MPSIVCFVQWLDIKLWKNSHTPWGDVNLEGSAMRRECMAFKLFPQKISPLSTIFFSLERKFTVVLHQPKEKQAFFKVKCLLHTFYNKKQPITGR